MTIEVLSLETEQQWLAARRKDVTASVVAALFGIHSFTTPYALWAEKSGAKPVDDVMNAAIMRGRLMESVAVDVLSMDHPDWDITHNTGEGVRYFRDAEARLGATPDTFVSCPLRGDGTVQIKSVEASIYRRKWCANGEPEPPLWIAVQAAVEAHLTGSAWAAVAPIVVSHGIEVPLIEIPLSDKVLHSVYAKVKDFWAMIESGEEPEPNFSLDAGVIDAMYAGDGSEIDLSSVSRITDLVKEYGVVSDRFTVAEARLEEIKTELKHSMQGSELAYLSDGKRMTWRRQTRRFPDGTQRTHRVLRVPKITEETPQAGPLACAEEPAREEPNVYNRWRF